MQPHVQDTKKWLLIKKGFFASWLFPISPITIVIFYTIFQNELREGSNEDEDDDEDEFNHVQDRHAEYSSNGHQIQLHITSDSQDEEHPTYTNLTNADNDTNDANESHYRRSYE